MIYYFKHGDIDKLKWDECISNSSNGLIYAYSWYLDAVSPGWEALIEEDYTSVMPLPMAKKYGYTYTYPALFTQQLGVFSLHAISEEKAKAFISAIPPHYRYIEMHLNEQNGVDMGSIKAKEHITYLLNLNRPYDEIAASYSTQTKRNLKKALSSSLTIVQSAQFQKIIKLFRQNRGAEHELPDDYYSVLSRLIKVLSAKKLVKVMGVNDRNNEMCAGAFFVKSKDRDIFLFSGANKNAYDTHAMTLLINYYLEENAGTATMFDFEGSMNPALARFYGGFGSIAKTFPVIRKNTLPVPIKWMKEMQYKRRTANN